MPNKHQGRRNADQALLLALACGATAEAAAKSTGISHATVHRRLKDAAFQAKLRALHTDMVKRATFTLTAGCHESIKTLLELQKQGQPPGTRPGAAKAIIYIAMMMREQTEIETRLAALEEREREREAG